MQHHRYLSMALVALGAMALLVPHAASPQDREQEILLQKAIQKETVDGDLNAAIEMYRRIAENPGEDRAVAAKALLQIGKCYEKLGSQEARKAYETLLKQYSDQSDIATEARTRLAALTKPADDSGIRMRRIGASPTAPPGGSLSPDGRLLVHTDWDSGGNVSIRELSSGKTRLVTSYAYGPGQFALYPIMSTDGKQIAFSWYSDKPSWDLRVVGIDGGEPRILYADGNYEVMPASWSPDGRQIAFRRYILKEAAKGRPLTTDIALIDVADDSIRVLKSFEGQFWPQIFYSDDGRYFAYDFPSDKDSGRYDISLLAIDGSREVPLVRHPANDKLLGWIPGTRDLLFRSDRSGTYDLYVLHMSGDGPDGAPEPIKRAIGEINPVGFVDDGSFYFSIYTRAGSLLIAPFDLQSGKIQFESATTDRGSNMLPMWSPDGNYLAFATERHRPGGPGQPFRRLRIRNMKTGDIRETAPHLIINQLYCWAPDARAIIVRGSDTERQGRYGIYQVELPGGNASLLFELADDDKAAVLWTAGRKAIVYSRSGPIIMRDLETRDEIQLSGQSGLNIHTISVSPDGENLALGISRSQSSLSKIVTIPISGGAVQELAALEAPQTLFGDIVWTPDGKYLFFPVAESQNSHILYRIRAEGGKPERIWELKEVIAGISIHPDSKQIALSSLTQATEIWAMENLRQWLNKK
jgi:Tol biopolymer transport system component